MKSNEQILFAAWPTLWPMLAWINSVIPKTGIIRRVFERAVFTKPWNRFYRSAYIPHLRNIFFEYILTFFYQYPIRRGDTIVQIGASFGEETARFARAVGAKGRVIAIEPELENIKTLRATFPQNLFPQVTIVPLGAWDKRETLEFFVGGEREHRLKDIPGNKLTYEWWGVEDHLDDSRYKSTRSIEVDTLDNIIKQLAIDKIDFILVETNGSELEVIKGARETLKKVNRLGVRGHVKRDGVPIYKEIAEVLSNDGFKNIVTTEGMVLAKNSRFK